MMGETGASELVAEAGLICAGIAVLMVVLDRQLRRMVMVARDHLAHPTESDAKQN